MIRGVASKYRIGTALGLLLCTVVYGQQQFEVASVKLSSSGDPRTLLQVLPGGGLRTSGATLKFLITLAYQVRAFQILGGPGWISSDRFDVIANPDRSTVSKNEAPDPTKVTATQFASMQDEMRPQLVALLAHRYKLKIRHETREQPVFELTVDRNGPKFRAANGNFGGLHMARNQLTGEAATIEMLSTALANQVGRPVLDKTGLAGSFDFRLTWSPQTDNGIPPAGGGAASGADQTGPSIFTAVQEQLGLELKSAKGPVEVLIIDHVEKPGEN